MTEGDLPELESFARLAKGDPWAAGDYLVERFPEAKYPATNTKAGAGLLRDLDHLSADLDRLGHRLSTSTLRGYRSTALAWPSGRRLPEATFEAHRKVRGEDRQEVLAGYVERAKREGALKLTERRVATYREAQRPRRARAAEAKTLGEDLADAVERSCRSRLRSAAGVIVDREDWWATDRLTDADRAALAKRLADLAQRIART